MSVRHLFQGEDPCITRENTSVSDFASDAFLHILKDLIDTMREADLVGIAAPQIGENYQIFLTEPRETKFRPADQSDLLRVYINPHIISVSDEHVEMYEGCGSVSSINEFGPVNRPKEITIEASDQYGTRFRLSCNGLLARVIQHEMDHVKGILFSEKVSDRSKLLTFAQYREFKKTHPEYFRNGIITKKEFMIVQ